MQDAWCKDLVKEEVIRFFERRFIRIHGFDVKLENVQFNSKNTQDNENLIEEFSKHSVGVVLDYDGNRSPGPDGFNFNFFKKFGNILKREIIGVNNFYKDGRWPKGGNVSFGCMYKTI